MAVFFPPKTPIVTIYSRFTRLPPINPPLFGSDIQTCTRTSWIIFCVMLRIKLTLRGFPCMCVSVRVGSGEGEGCGGVEGQSVNEVRGRQCVVCNMHSVCHRCVLQPMQNICMCCPRRPEEGLRGRATWWYGCHFIKINFANHATGSAVRLQEGAPAPGIRLPPPTMHQASALSNGNGEAVMGSGC